MADKNVLNKSTSNQNVNQATNQTTSQSFVNAKNADSANSADTHNGASSIFFMILKMIIAFWQPFVNMVANLRESTTVGYIIFILIIFIGTATAFILFSGLLYLYEQIPSPIKKIMPSKVAFFAVLFGLFSLIVLLLILDVATILYMFNIIKPSKS
ncbi:hypothetical protein NEFER03_0363 [Nematocida sp. LUAm3]|nr:hypothetical protein NEFER03_0363 [Nematocida sp. LUAm3]KAI5176021.1 hypothetical protein NEFER02_1867 [Nematocida sp. LUAm2]KAI5179118.1 hypothetical protein NEFER01_1985 [Nematocida sp. LUAm1]